MFWNKKLLKIQDKLSDLVGACYCIASADGNLDEAEKDLMCRHVQELTDGKTSIEEIHRLLDAAAVEAQQKGNKKFLKSIGAKLDRDGRDQVLKAAAATIMADGKLSESETAVFADLAEYLGFEVDYAEEILDGVIGS